MRRRDEDDLCVLLFECGLVSGCNYCQHSTFVFGANTLFVAMRSLLGRFNPFGKVTEVSSVHLLNADSPMLVNPSGNVTEVSSEECSNAESPTLVSPPGKVTEVSHVQL